MTRVKRPRPCAAQIVPKTFEVFCACGWIDLAKSQGEAESKRGRHLKKGRPLSRESRKDAIFAEAITNIHQLFGEAFESALAVAPPGEALGILQGAMKVFSSERSKEYLKLYNIAGRA